MKIRYFALQFSGNWYFLSLHCANIILHHEMEKFSFYDFLKFCNATAKSYSSLLKFPQRLYFCDFLVSRFILIITTSSSIISNKKYSYFDCRIQEEGEFPWIILRNSTNGQ